MPPSPTFSEVFWRVAVLAGLVLVAAPALSDEDNGFAGDPGAWETGYEYSFYDETRDAVAGLAESTSTAANHTLWARRQSPAGHALKISYATTDYLSRDRPVPAGFTEAGSLAYRSREAGLDVEYVIGPVVVSPSVTFGFDRYRYSRADTTVFAIAEASTTGWHVSGDLEITVDLPVTDWLVVQPLASAGFRHLEADAFRESGAGLLNAAYDRVADTRVDTALGALLTAFVPAGGSGYAMPFVQARWVHNHRTDPVRTEGRLIAGGPSATVPISAGPDADVLRIDAGIVWRIGEAASLGVNYEADFGRTTRTDVYTFGASWSF